MVDYEIRKIKSRKEKENDKVNGNAKIERKVIDRKKRKKCVNKLC